MVKWTNKLAHITQITKPLVESHKVIPKCLFSWNFFMVPFVVNISTQTCSVKIIPSKKFTNIRVQKTCLNLVLEISFMTLNVLNLNFFYVLLIHNEFERNIKKIVEKTNVTYF